MSCRHTRERLAFALQVAAFCAVVRVFRVSRVLRMYARCDARAIVVAHIRAIRSVHPHPICETQARDIRASIRFVFASLRETQVCTSIVKRATSSAHVSLMERASPRLSATRNLHPLPQ